jgi:ATP-dependent Lhr-like helicase
VTAAQFLRFLTCWQHVDPDHRVDGPAGVAEVVEQLAGFEVPAAGWEGSVLPARVRGYRREWLDQLTMGGEVVWGRFWGAAQSPVRRTPVALVLRSDLDMWTALAAATARPALGATADEVLVVLRARGAVFVQEIARESRLPLASVEEGLGALVAQGRLTCDSFGGLRWLLLPAAEPAPRDGDLAAAGGLRSTSHAEFVARRLLRRTGVVFRRTVLRERIPIPWRDVARACRTLEARGEVRGGRFVAGFDGEQYALPEAVTMLRSLRRKPERPLGSAALHVSAADPLNFKGILTPDERVPASAELDIRVG